MSCPQNLVSVSVDCKPNKGGIVKAYIAQYEDGFFEVYADDTTNIPSQVIGYNSGASQSWESFKVINFRRNTSNFTSTLNRDDANGISYIQSDIALQFSKMETSKRLAVAAMALGEMMVVIEDANGEAWAFGVDRPVTASASVGNTGTNFSDGNNYQITLTDISDYYPIPLTQTAYNALKAALD